MFVKEGVQDYGTQTSFLYFVEPCTSLHNNVILGTLLLPSSTVVNKLH